MKQFEEALSGLTSIRGHHFLNHGLNSQSVVLDLGAHLGEFSAEMIERFGCRCLAVEANPKLAATIRSSSQLVAVKAAVAGRDGPIQFSVDDNPEASRIGGNAKGGNVVEVEGLTMKTLMSRHGFTRVDLLKIDIEGAEFALLDSLDDAFLRTIPQITIEFHDFIVELDCARQVEEAKQRLKRLGFGCVVFSAANNGDVLFLGDGVRQQLSRPRWAYLTRVARYSRGLERRVRRLLAGPEVG